MDTPTISVYNLSTEPLPCNLDAVVTVLQKYVDQFVVPAWNTPAKIVRSIGPVPGTWGFALMDDADSPGALAYHMVDGSGNPLLKAFVKTIAANNESLSVSMSHELVEALVDPNCERTVTRGDGVICAFETADPVEETTFSIDGIEVSDFVHPAYFGGASARLDQCGAIDHPFQLAKDGYQTVFQNGAWDYVFGSREKCERFQMEDRRGHRNEYRMCKSANP